MQIVQKHLIADHMSYSQGNMKMGLWEICYVSLLIILWVPVNRESK